MKTKIQTKKAKVGILGLGYIGLPLAVASARTGFKTTGIDLDPNKIDKVNRGISTTLDIADSVVANLVKQERLFATTNEDAIKEQDVIVICVPTPVGKTKEPDLSFVVKAAKSISRQGVSGKVVILESTSYPGTTDELVMPILAGDKYKPGQDFFLAYSPERIDPGNKSFDIKNTPKVVGGITQTCGELASLFYKQFVERVETVSSTKTAEMAKLLENIYRCVNIALVNELMMLSDRMDIDIWEAIDAAATKPFGFTPFYPGPGIGGHCIPVDPFYLSWKARQYDFFTEFIELAGKINQNMPYYVLSRITEELSNRNKSLKGAKLLILGVAYKKDIADTRNSPALKLMELFTRAGALVKYHDPFVDKVTINGESLASIRLDTNKTSAYDCVVIATDHSAIDYDLLAKNALLVIDTKNVFKETVCTNIIKI